MKNNYLFLFIFAFLLTQNSTAQWVLDESFNPQLFPGQEESSRLGIHGIAIDPDGKVWIQPLFPTDSIFTNRTNEWLTTTAIYIFEPNGQPASFSPLKVISYLTENHIADTLGRYWNPESNQYQIRFGRGLTTDPEGNIILSQNQSIFKVDFKTGTGIARNFAPFGDERPLTEAAVDAAGNIYVASVFPGYPIKRLNPYLEGDENIINSTEGFARDFEVSPDGSTIYWSGYTNNAIHKYSRIDAFNPFEQVPDTVLKGFSSESMTIHPVTGNLWLSSGSTFSPPNSFPGVETNWDIQTWYAFDVNQDLINNPSPVDSVKWSVSAGAGQDGRPRGIDFSPNGRTVYIGNFDEKLPAIQKYDYNGSFGETSAEIIFSVNIGPFIQYGEFNPDSDYLSIAGDFNDWDFTNNPLEASQDSIYTITIPFFDFGTEDSIFYNFVLNREDGSSFTEVLDTTVNRVTFLNNLGSDSNGNGLKEKVLNTPFFNDFTYVDALNEVIAVSDSFVISSAFPDTLSVLGNDFLFGKDVIVKLALPTGSGNETIVDDSLIVFSPAPGTIDRYQKEYFIVSQSGDTLGNSFIDVTIIDNGPVVLVPDSVELTSGTSVVIEPLVNDTVISSELPLLISGVTNGEYGTADISLSQTKIIYRPISDFVGHDKLIYSVTGSDGTIYEQYIYLSIVEPVDTNLSPFILLPLEITTLEDSEISFGLHKVIADDKDPIDELDIFIHPSSNIIAGIDSEQGTMSISSNEDWWGQEVLRVTVTDTDGASRTDSSIITVTPVNDFPTSAFSVSGENNTLSFSDNSNDEKDFIEGAIVKWNWEFGDGNFSNEQNPEHTYSEIGRFDVALTVTDNGGLTATTSQSVFINTLVSNEDDSSNPTKFELNQNYPNPFNPSTKIKFALPIASEVRITIYNSLGQLVAELINARKNVGFHEVTFNASELSSGVYIYRIEAGSFIETKKMMLIK